MRDGSDDDSDVVTKSQESKQNQSRLRTIPKDPKKYLQSITKRCHRKQQQTTTKLNRTRRKRSRKTNKQARTVQTKKCTFPDIGLRCVQGDHSDNRRLFVCPPPSDSHSTRTRLRWDGRRAAHRSDHTARPPHPWGGRGGM